MSNNLKTESYNLNSKIIRQNFLFDSNITDKIVKYLPLSKTVIEIARSRTLTNQF